MEYVTLVDQAGKVIGSAEKLAAHRNGGVLHLGFSILVFNRRGELLLQQRAAGKYHFALLWSNTCCGHPRPLETPLAAAQRRLIEEFGFTTNLTQVGELSYVADDPVSELTERERLSVFVGEDDAEPRPNSDEIAAWRWVSLDKLARELDSAPQDFTPWFRRLAADFSQRGWPGPRGAVR